MAQQVQNFTAADIQNGIADLEAAQAAGILPKDDPGPACLKSVLADVGGPGNGSQYKVSGVVSGGAVLYILYSQTAGVQVSVACDAVLGKLTRFALKKGVQVVVPGAALLP